MRGAFFCVISGKYEMDYDGLVISGKGGDGMSERILDRRNVPFAMVTKAVLKDTSLKASDKSVYSVICMYADNRTSECYPSRGTLMKEAGVSDKTLRKSLDRLKERGYIDVRRRNNHRGRTSNLYVLLEVPSQG